MFSERYNQSECGPDGLNLVRWGQENKSADSAYVRHWERKLRYPPPLRDPLTTDGSVNVPSLKASLAKRFGSRGFSRRQRYMLS